ncbi:MAG TPA: diguanylate cyclase [Anaerolineales bacterium]|nr:diguanylate cyclase [Anaerolineales bacterium]
MNVRNNYWLSPPVFPDDEDKTRKAKILHTLQVSMLVTLLLAVFGVFVIFVNKTLTLALIIVMLAFVLASYWLALRGHVLEASLLFVSELWVVFSLAILLTGRFNSSYVSLHLAIIVMAGVLLGMRPTIVFSCLSVLFGFVLAFLESTGYPLVRYFPVQPLAGWFTWVLSIILILTPLTPTIQNIAYSIVALREKQRFIESILAATPNTIHLFDLKERRSVFSSRSLISALGYMPERSQSIDNDDLLHPEDRTQRSNLYKLAGTAKDGETLTVEYRMRTSSNEWRWFLERDMVFHRGVDGKPQQLIGIIMDITERKQLEAELERLATVDSLTGVLNRRKLSSLATVELERARRYGHSTSAIMLDIDYFKKINDTYGHAAGDEVLAGLAQLLTRIARTSDLVARYGGEEFVLILPETNITDASDFAERIRRTVADTPFVVEGQTIRFTVSLGVASSEQIEQDFESLLKETDRQLYRAKELGRNQVASRR